MKENIEIYNNIANLYMHRNIKEIYESGDDEIPFLLEDYEFPKYYLKTQFIPLIAYMNLRKNKDVKKIKLGKINYIELKNGAKGKFCSINKYFEVGDYFMPSFCYFASKQVAEQLREKGIDFDFVVFNRDEKDTSERHAVIRTNLPGFDKPVIIDGAISAIIEEELYFNLQPNNILAVYHNKDIPQKIKICYHSDDGVQFLSLENETEQEKQYRNVKTDQREM